MMLQQLLAGIHLPNNDPNSMPQNMLQNMKGAKSAVNEQDRMLTRNPFRYLP